MVLIHLITGFEEIEALTVCDLLRREDIPVKTVSLTGEKMVQGAHGIRVEADILMEEADYDDCDMIVLPGGEGAFRLRDHEELGVQIRKFAQEDRPLAAICAAPMVLGRHGVLEGKKATIYPGMEEFLSGAVSVKEPAVRDGNIITGRGPAAAMDFALTIVEFFKGAETVKALKKDLLLER